MIKPLIICLVFIYLLINGISASETHSLTKGAYNYHNCESNSSIILGYQFGYSEIRPKNRHMADSSGAFIGIHLMKPIENIRFNNNFYLAAGAHTIFTEDEHFGLMLGIMYSINETTMISIMPGLMLMKHGASHSNIGMGMSMGHMSVANNEWEAEEAIHIEIAHTITLFNRIFNPSLSWMSSSSHNQYSLGLNFHF